jgi:fumarate hydratase class II
MPDPHQTDGPVPAGSDDRFRVEKDSMGEVRVPVSAKWRAQTQRAVENFPISGQPIERELIAALAVIKGAGARVRAKRGLLDPTKAEAIAAAAAEVAKGDWDAEFPIDVFQTGSGTSSNMNTNEVLASLAADRLGDGTTVHPNDDVNDPLSSNDQFPSAIHVAATKAVVVDLVPALGHLARALEAKSSEFAKVVKSGRTHLMDATPVTLGQEFGGYAAAVRYGIDRLEATLPRVAELPLGGTAVGTGINAPAGFAAEVIALIAGETGLPLTEARDHFEAQGSRDGLVELSGALRTVAVSLNKISNDIRWMGSGPRTGLTELFLPDLQPGSSIMPGKVNPVLCEAVCQVVAQVIGNDAAVTSAEQWFGEGVGIDNFAVITIGAGIGCGLVVNSRIQQGSFGVAGELGHLCVDIDGPRCHCGGRGCVEAIVGREELLTRATRTAGRPVRSMTALGELARSAAGAPIRALLDHGGRCFAMAVAGVVNVFGPRRILISAEGFDADELFGPGMRETLHEQCFGRAAEVEVIARELPFAEWARGAAVIAITDFVARLSPTG